MLYNTKLIQKYDKPGPRYTSYPPANFFQSGFSSDDYKSQIEQSNQALPHNLSFYFHVPFCPQLCHFCGCNTDLMRNKTFVTRYFAALRKEFLTVSEHLDKTRKVTQIHWGGGTPNAVSLKEIASVMNLVRSHFHIDAGADVAMECNPAYLTYQQVDELADMGINRISIGVQDFNTDVLRIINRKPSKLPVEVIAAYMKSKNMTVNLDFVYGLPGQTTESFGDSIRQALSVSPDRIVTFSYAHVPWVKEAQKILEAYAIPAAEQKLDMFGRAFDLIIEAGYVPIGLDHFARPEDEMAKALNDRTLHRNFMGYCVKKHTGQVYAFGSTAISQLDNAYIQNLKPTVAYMESVESSGLAADKGYQLTFRDKVCREIINTLMCNHFVDLNAISAAFNLSLNDLFDLILFDESELQPLLDDHLVTLDNYKLTILPEGKMFLRNVAMLFDPLLKNRDNSPMRFSKTV